MPLLQRFRSARPSGICLDFDGTLAEIVARPALARPEPGALEVLASLVRDHAVVAVVSGRPRHELERLLPVEGLHLVGLYGHDEGDLGRDRLVAARDEAEAAADLVPGAWVEDKGGSLAVHYRQAADPAGAQALLTPRLAEIARRRGLSLFPGKMVVEIAAGTIPGKGSVIRRLGAEQGLGGCLFAGDDQPDLDAFAALDELRSADLVTVKVAVRSEETPPELIAAADVVVDRPSGLVRLLEGLISGG